MIFLRAECYVITLQNGVAEVTHQAKIEPTPEVLAANKRFQEAAKHDRRRLKAANTSEAVDWQERHAPTEAVMVKVANRVEVAQGIVTRRVLTQERCRVRKVDARLLDSLHADQIAAMEAIYEGWRVTNGALSFGVAEYGERAPKGTATSESAFRHRSRMQSQYETWARDCKPSGVNCAAVLDVVVYGHSLNAVNAARKLARGGCDSHWAKSNLVSGLNLYCRLFRVG